MKFEKIKNKIISFAFEVSVILIFVFLMSLIPFKCKAQTKKPIKRLENKPLYKRFDGAKLDTFKLCSIPIQYRTSDSTNGQITDRNFNFFFEHYNFYEIKTATGVTIALIFYITKLKEN